MEEVYCLSLPEPECSMVGEPRDWYRWSVSSASCSSRGSPSLLDSCTPSSLYWWRGKMSEGERGGGAGGGGCGGTQDTTSRKPYLVLRDTLCSCEAHGMRPMCKKEAREGSQGHQRSGPTPGIFYIYLYSPHREYVCSTHRTTVKTSPPPLPPFTAPGTCAQ